MEVKDLKPRTGKVDITLEITEKSEPKEFAKFGSVGRVCNAKGKDATGTISITLWNEQIDNVNTGDTVHISNGYVSEYQGEMQLSTGKFGQLEIVGAEKSAAKPAKAAPQKPAPKAKPKKEEEKAKEPEEELEDDAEDDFEEEMVE
jgi:ssDNA-binding replication factor A large subunit